MSSIYVCPDCQRRFTVVRDGEYLCLCGKTFFYPPLLSSERSRFVSSTVHTVPRVKRIVVRPANTSSLLRKIMAALSSRRASARALGRAGSTPSKTLRRKLRAESSVGFIPSSGAFIPARLRMAMSNRFAASRSASPPRIPHYRRWRKLVNACVSATGGFFWNSKISRLRSARGITFSPRSGCDILRAPR